MGVLGILNCQRPLQIRAARCPVLGALRAIQLLELWQRLGEPFHLSECDVFDSAADTNAKIIRRASADSLCHASTTRLRSPVR